MISNTDPLYSEMHKISDIKPASECCDRLIEPELYEVRKTVQLAVQEALAEIAFDDLRPADQILIHTNNSIYRFTVIDPLAPLGQVIGGPLGDYPEEAILFPMPGYEKISSSDFKRLRAGWRVSFLIKSSVGTRRLTTSAITRIAHIKIVGEVAGL